MTPWTEISMHSSNSHIWILFWRQRYPGDIFNLEGNSSVIGCILLQLSLSYHCYLLFVLNQEKSGEISEIRKSVRRDGSQTREGACHPWRSGRHGRVCQAKHWATVNLKKLCWAARSPYELLPFPSSAEEEPAFLLGVWEPESIQQREHWH